MIERSLSAKRFIINPESQQLLEEARSEFFELKEQYSELAGMAFWGSRTLGREKPESDIDCVLFSDSSETFPHHLSHKSEIVQKINEELNSAQKNKNPLIPYTLMAVVNISQEATDKDIADFINLLREHKIGRPGYEEDNISRTAPVGPLVARFFLGIGDGLYKNRKYIFDKLAQEKNGDEIWRKIVEYLQYTERTAKTKKRSSLPVYENYPKTIVEARNFFIDKDIYKEYKTRLEELKIMEKNAVYSEKTPPKYPKNYAVQETKQGWMFIGFVSEGYVEGKTGVAEFCFGEKNTKSTSPLVRRMTTNYRYMTQAYFDLMIQKASLVIDALEKANSKK